MSDYDNLHNLLKGVYKSGAVDKIIKSLNNGSNSFTVDSNDYLSNAKIHADSINDLNHLENLTI